MLSTNINLAQVLRSNHMIGCCASRYAGIIPQRLDMNDERVRALQLMLVGIGQLKIEKLHGKQHHYQKMVRMAMERQEGRGSAQFEENRHVLEPPGWSRRCLVLQMWQVCHPVETRPRKDHGLEMRAGGFAV